MQFYHATTLTRLADTHHAAGDFGAALRAWEQAIDILVELDHPDADAVRAKLDAVSAGVEASS